LRNVLQPTRALIRLSLAGAAVLALLPACTSGGGVFGSSASPTAASPAASSASAAPASDSRPITARVQDILLGAPSQEGDPRIPRDEYLELYYCPSLDVRTGASTWSVSAAKPREEPSPTTVRYQGSFGQMARECLVVDKKTMRIRVGVEGRVIVGPAGGPGSLSLPLRLAVVHEGPTPKTIWTQFYRIPVTVPADATNVPFTVLEDIQFPLPSESDLDSYIVYVGFDPAGDKPAPAARRKQRSKS
jgi:hypothetical protein